MVSVLPRLSKIRGIALDFIFPKKCVNCGREGSFICPTCQNALPRLLSPYCTRCGRPNSVEGLCSRCAEWDASIEGIRAPFAFDGTIRKAVYALKYNNIRALAPLLAHLLYEYITETPLTGEVLIPVPLHSKRIKERGYNQSGLLALELGKLTGLPVNESYLLRKISTTSQTKTKNVHERRRNVENAFACSSDELKDKQVLLIDDVTTSGATFDACSRALKESGVVSVWGLALAREL